MKHFLDQNFLLENQTAKVLYHDYAASMPIIDYHCHLSPSHIAEDKQFDNLSKIWLDGDHYKWRVMRTLGIDEQYITGDADDEQKFNKWAKTVPYTIRNPLYHWTHMELKNYFGIEKLLDPTSAQEIYHACSQKLQSPEFSARNLLRKMNVEVICTTDDPIDSLNHHQKIKEEAFERTVLPAFRPDKAYAIEDVQNYNAYLDKLEKASGIEISGFDQLIEALSNRIDYFHRQGCRLADHGLEKLHYEKQMSPSDLNTYFLKLRSKRKLDDYQTRCFKYGVLIELGRLYHQKGWVQQFHLGALRNTNERMLHKLGPDTGFDSIGDFSQSRTLAKFLNELDATNQLTKTILYNLNPTDNEVMATMIGNFNDGSVKGKMQYGSAWWFLDQKDGMEKQLNVLSNMGLLSCFIGMLTDSRSFLSYPRHEYFRRILCNLIGKDVENGELPNDTKWLGKIVSDICYHNAKEYFNFNGD